MAERRRAPEKPYIVSSGDVRPIPDPTVLTSSLVDAAKEDIRRELTSIQSALVGKIEAVLGLLQARLDASDKAIVLLQTSEDRFPAQVKERVEHLHQLVMQRFATQEEHFRGIQTQFVELDKRIDQSATASKIAIDAALQGQREMSVAQNLNIAQALARIEATGQKQTEQVVTLAQTSSQATNDKVDDLKERLSLIEGRTAGITAADSNRLAVTQTSQGASGNVLSLIAVGVAALAFLATIASIIAAIIMRP